jgi:hypothetical protein
LGVFVVISVQLLFPIIMHDTGRMKVVGVGVYDELSRVDGLSSHFHLSQTGVSAPQEVHDGFLVVAFVSELHFINAVRWISATSAKITMGGAGLSQGEIVILGWCVMSIKSVLVPMLVLP